IAIWTGSLSETLRVRLLSMAQARQAPAIASGPRRSARDRLACQESTTAPAAIAAMPRAIRRSKFSRKTNQATRTVATDSRLSKSEVEAALLRDKPIINRTGPTTRPQGPPAKRLLLAAIGHLLSWFYRLTMKHRVLTSS